LNSEYLDDNRKSNDTKNANEIHGGGEAMNDFEKQIAENTGDGLYSLKIDVLQVNLGLRCNQQCVHCHLEASPLRTERMEWPVMELVLEAAKHSRCRLVDLTGGAPELNPHFRAFITALRKEGHRVQVRTNLTILQDPGMEEMLEFFKERSDSGFFLWGEGHGMSRFLLGFLFALHDQVAFFFSMAT